MPYPLDAIINELRRISSILSQLAASPADHRLRPFLITGLILVGAGYFWYARTLRCKGLRQGSKCTFLLAVMFLLMGLNEFIIGQGMFALATGILVGIGVLFLALPFTIYVGSREYSEWKGACKLKEQERLLQEHAGAWPPAPVGAESAEKIAERR